VFGKVEAIGENVTHVKPGDYVTCTVRRPGESIYDSIGRSDITSEEVYYERGINLLHGYLTEYFVDDAEFIVRIPVGLRHLHVLAEPMSCSAKAIHQAYEAQKRLQVWEPKTAFVMGAGQIGLLATLILRLRGLQVYTFARGPVPNLKAEIVDGMEATYVSTREQSIDDVIQESGKPDIIFDATGNSSVSFGAMEHLNLNGVLIWTSITGGKELHQTPADKLNLEWVLGNKMLIGSVNANFRHFEMGIADLALGEMTYPGVLEKILTNPVEGLEQYGEMMRLLVDDPEALKVFVNVAEDN
ncbi:MAG: glucose dehydrogenase, partial [Planctomycetaceae bacterium]|nr:glucose dehydrogenase [Planctomycetaceae bacterium]